MSQNSYLEQAKQLLLTARGKSLSTDERKRLAIELAAQMLNESAQRETVLEQKQLNEISGMVEDPVGKIFMMNLTDQCFRSQNSWRVADQLSFLIHRYGVPQYLSLFKRAQLIVFKSVGRFFAPFLVNLVKRLLHKECSRFILPGEEKGLTRAILKRQEQGVRVNLNHLGEAILGEEEALHRLNIYLKDLARPEVEYISVKVSTIYSQIQLVAWEESLKVLSERLKLLLKTAHEHYFIKKDGTRVPKFVNLDMEEYRDLDLTVDLFKRVLNDPAFFHYSAGIVLQSYLPDSYLVQQDLTVWAMQRLIKGGAPIKIRLVKGANLAMEQVDASLHGWPQAPYLTKKEVDANYKRMVNYGLVKEHAQAAHIGIASHNLFDIAYGLLLRAENGVEKEVCFEMLEGMADTQRHVVQELAKDMLVYCPAATKTEFQNAVAYLVRRLDENTSQENYLRHAFQMKVGSKAWNQQVELFSQACEELKNVSMLPRRTQNRFHPENEKMGCRFVNEEDTDWSLYQNRLWAHKILADWSQRSSEKIPLVIGGKIIRNGFEEKLGYNPLNPDRPLYSYTLADNTLLEEALDTASKAHETWKKTSLEYRLDILSKVGRLMKISRGDLMGVMMADTAKIISEADVEISEAIDFVDYYSHNIADIMRLSDIQWNAKGPVLITPPWNFPCSIPVGGIVAALAAGNSVIFKPAPEAVWVGWMVAQIFWEAGIGKDVLQFVNCQDKPYGSQLIKDSRIALVVLTGATSTARKFLKIRADLHLIAETGGKNAIVVSNMGDRDLAVKDIVQSAFGHAGQKCSACSLVICLPEVYEDPSFLRQLRDAAASWKVGAPWDPATRLNPLIRPPEKTLYRGLTQLEKGEEWLLEPKVDSQNPCLWTPGIKLGVLPGSFTYKNELFGPVLGVMKAHNLEHAIDLVNKMRYGLTSGLHSLDLREQTFWSENIQAGNCYINRGITGAIVQRQPFGGWKDSCFSPGAKAGGPNYVMQFLEAEQLSLPLERVELPETLNEIISLLGVLNEEDREIWHVSAANYAFYWKHYFSLSHDPSQVLGEDNFLRYIPRQNVNIRLSPDDEALDVLRVLAAADICGAELIVSSPLSLPFKHSRVLVEDEQHFMFRMKAQRLKRIRFFSKPELSMFKFLTGVGSYITVQPVLANGRVELLRYLREQSLSIAYHRYGNLGEREGELRQHTQSINCQTCCHHDKCS